MTLPTPGSLQPYSQSGATAHPNGSSGEKGKLTARKYDESAQERQRMLDLFGSNRPAGMAQPTHLEG
ncbi:hypothetical protein ACFLXJ_05100 [Chloroflexota bacterium]